MALPTPQTVTNMYLYGQASTPSKVNDALIRASNETESINLPYSEFMTNGAGRFALGANFELIQRFFTNGAATLTANTTSKPYYTKHEVGAAFNLDYYGLEIDHKVYRDGTNDYKERVYIFNNEAFLINDEAKFIVNADGTVKIDQFAVVFDEREGKENFDFDSDQNATKLGNILLEDAIDPYGIGRKVEFNLTNITTKTYTSQIFQAEQAIVNSWTVDTIFNPLAVNNALATVAESLWEDGVTKFLDTGDKPIIYGTVGNDSLHGGTDINGSVWADANNIPTIDDTAYETNGVTLISGTGNDTVRGGVYSDRLLGGDGDDHLYGGKGNDTLDGGDDKDTAFLLGNCFEYDFEWDAEEKSWTVTHARPADTALNFGTDTLKNIEFVQFSADEDTLHSLQNGTAPCFYQYAILIDNTTSMAGEITTLKSKLNDIVDSLFYDADGNPVNAQVSIAGYEPLLAFTEQVGVDARSDAVKAAINGIQVDSTFEYEELVYLPIVNLLQGSAGEWQEEAVTRRIIVLSDAAPYNDTSSWPWDETSFHPEASAAGVQQLASEQNVEIFTVYSTSSAGQQPDGLAYGKRAWETIAADNGGQSFTATQDTIADTLMAAITTPSPGGEGSQLTGSAADDTISGTQGDDTVYGKGGNDKILGYEGNDFLYGNNDNDQIFGGLHHDFMDGGYNQDFMDGGDGNDTVYGNFGNDTVYGGKGNDVLLGNDGDDTLDGGDQRDSLSGGNDDDRLYGRDGDDSLYGNNDHDHLFGSHGDDLLDGGSGDDFLDAGTGDDTVYGGHGDDRMYGSHGQDALLGGSGDDMLDGGQDNDRLYGRDDDDRLYGRDGDDSLFGNAGNDRLYGNDGNDSLHGDAGADSLRGDAGDDMFFFTDATHSTTTQSDHIADFIRGEDTIMLQGITGVSGFADLTITETAGVTVVSAMTGDFSFIIDATGLGLDASDFSVI